jgi:hypothetical protein
MGKAASSGSEVCQSCSPGRFATDTISNVTGYGVMKSASVGSHYATRQTTWSSSLVNRTFLVT